MTPENAIKNSICSWLSFQRDCLFFIHDSVGIFDPVKKRFRANKSPYRKKGVSDILGSWKGRFLAIEVKTPKNYLTPEQKAFLEEVRVKGGIGILARSIDDVKAGIAAAERIS